METEINSLTTAGITVQVETTFIEDQSSFEKNHFTYAYRITITNHSDLTVQLMRRRWVVTDGLGQVRVIEGEGVVGQQPVLAPREFHTYVSGTHFKTVVGKMEGAFIFRRLADGAEFEAGIPVFVMEVPVLLN